MGKSKRDKVLQLIIHHQGEAESLRDKIMQLFEKPKKQTEPDPCHNDFKNAWNAAYPELEVESARDGACINKLIDKTRRALIKANKDTSPDELVKAFKYVLWWVQTSGKYPHNEPLTTWEKMYLSVISKIKESPRLALQVKPNSSQVFGKYGN